MVKNIFKIFIFILVLVFIFSNYFFVFSQSSPRIETYNLLVPLPVPSNAIPGTGNLITEVSGPAFHILVLYYFAVGFIAIIAFVMLVVAGFLWATSGGRAEQVSRAKNLVSNALLGVLIIILSWVFLRTLEPHLVNLKEPTIVLQFCTDPNPEKRRECFCRILNPNDSQYGSLCGATAVSQYDKPPACDKYQLDQCSDFSAGFGKCAFTPQWVCELGYGSDLPVLGCTATYAGTCYGTFALMCEQADDICGIQGGCKARYDRLGFIITGVTCEPK